MQSLTTAEATPPLPHVPQGLAGTHESVLAPCAPADELAVLRLADAAVDSALTNRRSTRVFSARALSFDTVRILFEAARFAPSDGNVQPWLFVYAHDRPTRKRALTLLDDESRRWAARAPLLIFVFARRTHPSTGAPLRTGAFDAGAAWFSLALQAQKLGLNCRAIGDIQHERVSNLLGVPVEFESMIAVAIGYPGREQDMPAGVSDAPSSRKRQYQFVFNGRYTEREA